MKTIGTILLFVAFGLFVYTFYAMMSVNWDVPSAMITAHQSWDAFVAGIMPFIGSAICLWLGTLFCIYKRSK